MAINAEQQMDGGEQSDGSPSTGDASKESVRFGHSLDRISILPPRADGGSPPIQRTPDSVQSAAIRGDAARISEADSPAPMNRSGLAPGSPSQEADTTAIVRGRTDIGRNGQPLAAETRAFFEPRFGFDFGSIRIHADDAAAKAAQAVNAHAYTLGDNIVFGTGRYDPKAETGRSLLAHELTHVVQSQRASAAPTRAVSDPADAAEVEATTAAQAVMDPAAEAPPGMSASPTAHVQREPASTTAPPPPAVSTPAGNPPAPGGAPANSPGMSEEDARRLIYAQTTLKQIPPLEAHDKDTLQQATKDATVFTFIEQRDEKRKELDQETKAYQELNANIQDTSGPPTAAQSNQQDDLKHRVDRLTEEVNNLDNLIKPILESLHVTEDQLVTLVSETFPNMFVTRGKQIAMQQLQTNQEMAEREKAKYEDVFGAGDVGRPKIDGLRNAAKDLSARQKAIDEQKLKIQVAHQDMPPGGAPDPAQQGSSAYDLAHEDELRADIEQKQQDLTKTRQTYARDYQILFRDDIDVDRLAVANDDQLRQIVGSKVQDILDNIQKTRENIQDDKVKIWTLQDIVGMTMQDLAVGSNPTLVTVVNRRRDRETAETQSREETESALKALALTAATIASIALLNPAPLLVVGAALGTIEVIQAGSQVARTSAARDVALDPTVAQMSSEEPEWIWLITSIAGLLLDVVPGAAMLRQHFRTLKAAAATLETFSAAARRAFPEKEAERLIEVASREIKAGLNLTAEITAIGGKFARQNESASRCRFPST